MNIYMFHKAYFTWFDLYEYVGVLKLAKCGNFTFSNSLPAIFLNFSTSF